MKELYSSETKMLSGAGLVLVLAFLAALTCFWAYCLITQPEGSDLYLPPYAAVLIFVLILALLALALFLKCKLRIFEDRIEITSIGTKTVKMSDIESCETIEVKAVRQFGGWGIRWLPNKIGYIIPEMDGVKIKCKDGKTVVICSDDPEKIIKIVSHQTRERRLRSANTFSFPETVCSASVPERRFLSETSLSGVLDLKHKPVRW